MWSFCVSQQLLCLHVEDITRQKRKQNTQMKMLCYAKEKAKEIVTITKYTLSLLGQTMSVLRQTICPGLIMLCHS